MGMKMGEKWWENQYETYKKSGLTISGYSRSNGLKRSTFYSWIQRFRERESPQTSSDEVFTQVTVMKPIKRKVKLNGVTLEFEDAVSYEEALKVIIGHVR